MSKMILKTLWVQRKCSYEGEYAPRCILAMDEWSLEEGDLWFETESKKMLEQVKDEITSHCVIDIEVSQTQIAGILNKIPKVDGEIL